MSVRTEPTAEQIREQRIYREMGLTDEEYQRINGILGRLPNYTETGLYGVMWSEHCSYKNSKPVLRRFPTQGPAVLQGPGEGAGIVDIGDGLAVAFKMESHNHPSAIEPYQGAATGAGGIIRDVFSMGARPVALLDSLRFGELDSPRVKYLFEQVVAGIAGYGNCVGIPTVGGEVYFDACYTGNPLVNVMCVGIIEHSKIQKGLAVGVGNPVIYIGASTGRDGIHGATFASEELTEESEAKRPSVQVGDPFMEKLLLEACLELIDRRLVLGIQDMGAAGLASSSSEMASKAGNGIVLDLDQVPQREENLSAYEMMLSESQERMLVVAQKGREQEIFAVCQKWGLQAAVIGHVTDDGMMRLLHLGQVVAELPVDSLAEDAPVYYRESVPPNTDHALAAEPLVVNDHSKALQELLASPSIASKRWVYSQYDHMVRTNTAVLPGSDAAVIRLRGTRKALALTTDGNSRYIKLDPYTGGMIAVAEAARNICCCGARPLAVTDCLNFGNPENPEIFWQLEQAVDGISEACRILATPVVSGNVSLYNETKGQPIFPSPIIGMVGLIEDLDLITTQALTSPGHRLLLLGESQDELGGSELQKLLTGKFSGRPPAIDLVCEKRLQDFLLAAIQEGYVRAAHDVAEGGLAVAVAEMAISGELGVELTFSSNLPFTALLFGESQSRIVVEADPQQAVYLKKEAAARGVPVLDLGVVTAEQKFAVSVNGTNLIAAELSQIKACWEDALPCLMSC